MPRIIDMECSVPYGANVEKKPAAAPAEAAAGAADKPAGYGMANYGYYANPASYQTPVYAAPTPQAMPQAAPQAK